MNIQVLTRKSGIILCLGLAVVLCGYFSLFLSIGTAVVMDPRDVLVVLAGVLTGPAGGALVGLFAGLPGSDRLVEIPMFMASGLASGLITNYCRAHREWIPSAALGLGCGYVIAGIILMGTALYGDVAAYAFRALIMINLTILILFILDSLDPGIFQWEKRLLERETIVKDTGKEIPVG